jgi:hypothetical protein
MGVVDLQRGESRFSRCSPAMSRVQNYWVWLHWNAAVEDLIDFVVWRD